MSNISVGKKAPNFKYIDSDGNSLSLSDLKGQKVLIYFYPRDNTPGCTKQACSLRDSMDDLLEKNIKVIGVSKDSEKSHANFKSKFNLNFDLVPDPDKKIISSYGVLNEKGSANRKSFLVDEQGKILFIWDKVKAASHGEEVLSFLDL
tara:strand:+ start:1818 stop:2261 length:444 start_codon:yes stop_codon:yes gene_type:complete